MIHLPAVVCASSAQHILKPTTEHPAAAAGLGPPNSKTGSSVLVCSAVDRLLHHAHVCVTNGTQTVLG